MDNQNLFNAIADITGHNALESEMNNIIDAVCKDLQESYKDLNDEKAAEEYAAEFPEEVAKSRRLLYTVVATMDIDYEPSPLNASRAILAEVIEERERQLQKWGEQNHPILDPCYMGRPSFMNERYNAYTASYAQQITDQLSARGKVTYMDILIEEVREAIEAQNAQELKKELIQTAAVVIAMLESLDRNGF